jgi:hypothetical protein
VVARSASLLAAVLLLFGLPRCAIDDRDLEETAGSTALCTPESDDSECIRCTKENCCDQYAECITSADCQVYVSCGAACDGDGPCITACDNDYPEGAVVFNAIVTCNTARCPDACT